MPPTLLMCRPAHYTIAYEINPWMSLKRQAHHAKALRQWQTLYRLLTRTLRVRVKLLPPQRPLPDLVFTAHADSATFCSNADGTLRMTERVGNQGDWGRTEWFYNNNRVDSFAEATIHWGTEVELYADSYERHYVVEATLQSENDPLDVVAGEEIFQVRDFVICRYTR